MKALLKSYRQSPRKVRMIADVVRGKNAQQAITELNFVAKRAAEVVRKLIESAVANSGKKAADLTISQILVNEGPTMKRSLPRARGMSSRINKRTSHISINLSDVIK